MQPACVRHQRHAGDLDAVAIHRQKKAMKKHLGLAAFILCVIVMMAGIFGHVVIAIGLL